MRNWKRVISVMLVLVMTISLTAIPAMAEEEKTTEKSLVYTCLGDSIAAGYSLPTYVARIDAGLVPVEGSYGKIVADALGADQYNAYGTSGVRTQEMLMFLKDGYYGDAVTMYNMHYWVHTDNIDKELPVLQKKIRNGLAESNLITMGVGVNDLWLTAVCESYLALSGQGSVSVQMEGHGREDIGAGLLTDRTIGWFTSMYPAVFEDVTGNPAEDLLNVKETLRRIPNKGVGYGLVRTPLGAPESVTPWISFNYLGEMDAEDQEGSFFRQESGISSGPIWDEGNYQGSALLINAFVQQGRLTLTLDYDRNVYSGEQAEGFARLVTENLKAAAECLKDAEEKITPSDLGETEWNREEFDRVCAGFAARAPACWCWFIGLMPE